MDKPLKLYVNKKMLDERLVHIPLLYPFWGEISKESTLYGKETNKYGFDKKYFEITGDIRRADYYLLPYDYWHLKWQNPELLSRLLADARNHSKKMLIDASGDVLGKIDVPEAVILRINQYRFDLPPNEITVPIPCEDLLASYCDGRLVLRKKKEVPSIGFVGWGTVPMFLRIKTLIKEIPLRFSSLFDERFKVYRKGVFFREKAMRIFDKSKKVKTNFLIRQSYSGHTKTALGDPEKNREEFVNNILHTDYTLVVKGDANAATRFYEALSLGRIPVFIDTACVLPLEDIINYRDFCVFIDFRDLKKAPLILAQFHSQISAENFIAMQQKARYIFRHFLRYDAFSEHLYFELKKRLS